MKRADRNFRKMDKLLNLPPVPQWIAPMYETSRGRDHLGLGSVSSDQILPSLSPGINVLTFHPRYHSFYVFLLDEFIRRERPASKREWIQFFRPREFIYSVGAYLCDQPEHGEMGNIVGGQKTSPLASRELPAYQTTTDYIDSEQGGYGLYYRTVMAELGLIYPGGPGLPYPVDIPTPFGREVAASFREAVETTEYYRQHFEQDDVEVPIDVVREYIRRACLCQLASPEALDQRQIRQAFLHNGPGQTAAARRSTFRLFLDLAHQTDGHALDEDRFRQLIYFQEDAQGLRFQPAEAVQETYLRWRHYQAREYYAFALNALWFHFCEWGLAAGGDVHPVPLSDFWDHLSQAVSFSQLAGRLEVPAPALHPGSPFADLMDWISSLANAERGGFIERFEINAPLHEHRLYGLAMANRYSADTMTAGMIALLALLVARLDNPELHLRPEWEIPQIGAEGRLSVAGFLHDLDRRMAAGPATIGEILRWLYQDYVILQHRVVATSKLPDNTFRFEKQGRRIRFFRQQNPLGFLNSRFDSLSTTVYELGFCGDLKTEAHPLTEDGHHLLTEGAL